MRLACTGSTTCNRAASPPLILEVATISDTGAILAAVTSPTLESEPACPAPPEASALSDRFQGPSQTSPRRPLIAIRRPFDAIPRPTWDELAAQTPWATPFSAWAFHR